MIVIKIISQQIFHYSSFLEVLVCRIAVCAIDDSRRVFQNVRSYDFDKRIVRALVSVICSGPTFRIVIPRMYFKLLETDIVL